eukprot:gene19167-biopygen28029
MKATLRTPRKTAQNTVELYSTRLESTPYSIPELVAYTLAKTALFDSVVCHSPGLMTNQTLKRWVRRQKQNLTCFEVVVTQLDDNDDAFVLNARTAQIDPDRTTRRDQIVLNCEKDFAKAFSTADSVSELRPDTPLVCPLIDPLTSPKFSRGHRLSPAELLEVEQQVKDLLAKGFIHPSSSPWGSPILFVAKPDGSWRMAIDYRKLNKVTIPNRYPLPRIDDLFDQVRGAKVLPFGLANAPSAFTKVMNTVFRDLIGKFVVIYLDDILIFSSNDEEHEKHLRIVLQRLEDNHLFIKREKCSFFQPEVKYLGHVLSGDGIRVNEAKVKAVAAWPTPTCSKHALQAAQDRQRTYANQHRRPVTFLIGHEVMLSTKNLKYWPGRARKLLPRFVGPFPVTRVYDKHGETLAATLDLPVGWRIHPTFHVSLLKAYVPDGSPMIRPNPDHFRTTDEPVYEIGRVVDHKIESGLLRY